MKQVMHVPGYILCGGNEKPLAKSRNRVEDFHGLLAASGSSFWKALP